MLITMIVALALLLAIACIRVAAFEITQMMERGKQETINQIAEDREGIPSGKRGAGTRKETGDA